MRIERFQMERTQSLYENEVRFNLSESGVQPLSIEELLGGGAVAGLLAQPLKYPESNGSRLLRERIALLYPGATADNVLVTNGTSEANYTVLWKLLEPGDRAAVMIPSYLQTNGLARAYGGRADPYRLVPRRRAATKGAAGAAGAAGTAGAATHGAAGTAGARWELDLDGLRRAVGRRTRVVVVTNPNNPTGAVLTRGEMEAIVDAARSAGAWIVADEVYRGAELEGDAESPTFWGAYPRVLVTSGLSKAYGLPGLRIGWIAGPAREIAALWGYQDYTTLTPSMLSDRLAREALEPGRRARLIERTRSIVRRQLPIVLGWVAERGDILDAVPPMAGAIALLRYRLRIGSVALFERLRREESVLITPGAHFGLGRWFRVGYGYEPQVLREGLERLGGWLDAFARIGPATRSRPRARRA
jgi:aspartate/methionine/tyrosine aminotransferase